jgi:threonine dehydrogenase-like Zn-dependent dehydrogenase
MRASAIRERSGPFVMEELRDPRPKDREIQVAATGVCHTDLHIHNGSVAFPLPCVLGHEVSGTVLEVGADVHHVAPSQRVVGALVMPQSSHRIHPHGIPCPSKRHRRHGNHLHERMLAADATPTVESTEIRSIWTRDFLTPLAPYRSLWTLDPECWNTREDVKWSIS